MYKVLGIINIVLIVAITSPLWLRKLNQLFFHTKDPRFARVLKALRTLHKPFGIALVFFLIPIHGYLALGGLRLHTGLIAWIAALATAALGLAFFLSKKRALFKLHRWMALAFILLIAVHLLFPSLLSYIG